MRSAPAAELHALAMPRITPVHMTIMTTMIQKLGRMQATRCSRTTGHARIVLGVVLDVPCWWEGDGRLQAGDARAVRSSTSPPRQAARVVPRRGSPRVPHRACTGCSRRRTLPCRRRGATSCGQGRRDAREPSPAPSPRKRRTPRSSSAHSIGPRRTGGWRPAARGVPSLARALRGRRSSRRSRRPGTCAGPRTLAS